MPATQVCPVCGGTASECLRGTVLRVHEAVYFLCPDCDFWFVHDPQWLDEAYSDAIGATDTGLVARNLSVRDAITPVLANLFDRSATFVDYAGGYGLLVRLMRDRGFDFRWQDAYAENLLARGFEWTPGSGVRAEVVTAIEVLEHTPDPVGFLTEILDTTGTDSVIVSQQLHNGVDPDWWYLAPATGQHIAFFSSRTMATLAEKVGATHHAAGWLHLITRRDLPAGAFARAVKKGTSRRTLPRPPTFASLAEDDHHEAVRRASGA